VVNPDQDLNLNGRYFLLFGEGERGGWEINSLGLIADISVIRLSAS